MKKLSDIIECSYDVEIEGVTDDSRNVEWGYLFVATCGFNVDHYDYIEAAIENGCSFVICDREITFDIPHLVVDNINDVFIECCRKFYDVDLDNYKFIGITGTDGKTTTTTLIQKILSDAAIIGTNGLAVVDKKISTNNTTPCVSELYEDLKYIRDNGCSNVVMEVSSEALLHDRVKNIKFDIVGFTNVTGDHLNIHGSFDNYVKCKMKLLDFLSDDGCVVVNGDDDILQKINCRNMSTFGFDSNNDFVICHVKYLSNFTEITVKYKGNNYLIKTHLMGKYNVYNVVMAFVIGMLEGIDVDTLISRIWEVTFVSGRCELLDFNQDYTIVLDYAHTINGIRSVLDAFVVDGCSRIITVTGCAGGREKDKRRVIGNMVMDKSDVAIFTMDDPRYEDVSEIINQMVGDREDYIRMIDREQAIKYALDIANKGDVVLILGKGRDSYMAIEDKKIPYCDYDVIKKYFS